MGEIYVFCGVCGAHVTEPHRRGSICEWTIRLARIKAMSVRRDDSLGDVRRGEEGSGGDGEDVRRHRSGIAGDRVPGALEPVPIRGPVPQREDVMARLVELRCGAVLCAKGDWPSGMTPPDIRCVRPEKHAGDHVFNNLVTQASPPDEIKDRKPVLFRALDMANNAVAIAVDADAHGDSETSREVMA